MKTINGEPVYSFRIFRQGTVWKWIIRTATKEYEGKEDTQEQAITACYNQFKGD